MKWFDLKLLLAWRFVVAIQSQQILFLFSNSKADQLLPFQSKHDCVNKIQTKTNGRKSKWKKTRVIQSNLRRMNELTHARIGTRAFVFGELSSMRCKTRCFDSLVNGFATTSSHFSFELPLSLRSHIVRTITNEHRCDARRFANGPWWFHCRNIWIVSEYFRFVSFLFSFMSWHAKHSLTVDAVD